MMKTCTIGKCPHGGCRTLKGCGAAHALSLATRSQGYRVIVKDNPTIDGLLIKKLIEWIPGTYDGWSAIVRAK